LILNAVAVHPGTDYLSEAARYSYHGVGVKS
jgi:hypothetical protein